MDLQQTLVDLARIRVLVVPVGPVAPAKFNAYLSLIRQFSAVALSDLSFNSADSVPAVFKRQAFKDGQMSFRFLTQEQLVLLDYGEDVISRRVNGVIGIMDLTVTTNIGEAYQEFASTVSKHPHILDKRCFAVEPADNQPDIDSRVIMIPNQSQQKVAFYMSTMISDYASSVLKELATQVGYLEDRSETRSVNGDASSLFDRTMALRVKKNSPARSLKYIADICLLGGSTTDAITYYQTAYDSARSNSDWLHAAGALEGLCCCTLLTEDPILKAKVALDPSGGLEVPMRPPMLADMVDKLKEAIGLYEKANARVLAIEACVKGARYVLHFRKRLVVCELLARANDNRVDLSIAEQLQVLATSVVLYRKTELFRKMIFHLHIAAELLTSTGHPLNGLAVLKALVHLYDGTANLASEPSYAALVSQASAFPGAAEGGEGDSSAPHSARPRSGTDQVPGLPGNQAVSAKETVLLVWPRLQISLLQELIRLCDQLDDVAQSVFYTAALLRRYHALLTAQEQALLLTRMEQLMATLVPTLGPGSGRLMDGTLDGLPDVVAMEYCSAPPHLQPIPGPADPEGPVVAEVAVDANAERDPFIYNPFARTKDAAATAIVLVQNEYLNVVVTVSNPFGIDLVIPSMRLSTSGVAFDAIPADVVIPAYTTAKEVTLTGRALAPGRLELRGVRIVIFGVEREHVGRVERQGAGPDASNNGANRRGGERKAAKVSKGSPTPAATPLAIEVIGAMPQLLVHDTHLFATPLQMWEGERFSTLVILENVGPRPVDYLAVSFEESQPARRNPPTLEEEYFAAQSHVLSWDAAALQARLPVLPGQTISLPMTVTAKASSNGGRLRLQYGQNSPAVKRPLHMRQSDITVSLRVKPLLEIVDLQLRPLDLHTAPSTGADTPLSLQAVLSLAVQNLGPAVVSVRLQSRQGSNENWDNDGPHRLPSNGVRRLTVRVPRLALDDRYLAQELPLLGDRQFIRSTLTLTEEAVRRRLFWMRVAVLPLLNATWQKDVDRCGVLPLAGAPWSAASFAVLRRPAYSFHVTPRYASDGPAKVVRCGEFVTFDVHVVPAWLAESTGDDAATSSVEVGVRLWASGAPVHPATAQEYILWDASASPDALVTLQIKPNASAQASVSAVFLTAGQFELVFRCQQVRPAEAATPDAAEDGSPPAPAVPEEPQTTFIVPLNVTF